MSPSVGSPSKVLNMSWVPEGMDSNPRLEHVPLPLLSKSPAVNTKSKRGRRKKTSVGEGVTGYGRLFIFLISTTGDWVGFNEVGKPGVKSTNANIFSL